jgi:phenylalanyl-tRNA synthetase beta chain
MISLIEFLSSNVNYPYPQKVFEIGKVYDLEEKEEKTNLAFAWSQNKITFNEAKQIIIYLLERIGVNKEKIKFKESNKSYLIKGRQAEVFIDNKKIAEIGEINPELLLKFNIEIPTIIGEIYIDKLK